MVTAKFADDADEFLERRFAGLRGALDDRADQCVVVATADSSVRHAAPGALAVLARWAPPPPGQTPAVPKPLADWPADLPPAETLAGAPPESLGGEGFEGLRARVLRRFADRQCVLLLTRSRDRMPPALLADRLGLTPREAEVLS